MMGPAILCATHLSMKLMEVRFGTWNVRSLYRVGLLVSVLKSGESIIYISGSAGSQMGGWWH
jgi:hypothetical protein